LQPGRIGRGSELPIDSSQPGQQGLELVATGPGRTRRERFS
jgi:hypothetical protein